MDRTKRDEATRQQLVPVTAAIPDDSPNINQEDDTPDTIPGQESTATPFNNSLRTTRTDTMNVSDEVLA